MSFASFHSPPGLSATLNVGQGWQFLNAMLESSAAALLLPTTQHERILNEVIAELPYPPPGTFCTMFTQPS